MRSRWLATCAASALEHLPKTARTKVFMAEGDALLQGEAGPMTDAYSSASVTVESGKKTKRVADHPNFHTLDGRNNGNLSEDTIETFEHERPEHISARQRIELSLRRVERMHKRLEHILKGYSERSPFSDKVFAYASHEIEQALAAVKEIPTLAEAVEEVGIKVPLTAISLDKMRRLRAEVETMLAEFIAVDRHEKNVESKNRAKLALLKKYSIPKWVGKRKNGGVSAYDFLMKHYGHWIRASVIFKDEVRCMDAQLVNHVNVDHHRIGSEDPLLTKTKRTDLYATGVLGADRQTSATAMQYRRAARREKILTKL